MVKASKRTNEQPTSQPIPPIELSRRLIVIGLALVAGRNRGMREYCNFVVKRKTINILISIAVPSASRPELVPCQISCSLLCNLDLCFARPF
ncbi:hypothetical protein X777_00475 [Ooceraea biroi]|uniref:Uncharacterized protein n=1 Tax=Ooceraea biroi TaxID=2015173 RepID=A0A026WTV2_OOCBI|nr:hypothetical protein X777_00475 [Ooceraea biroi]